MITPAGSSEGSITIRPMVSHPTTSAAPKSAAPGTRKRLSDPISSRTMCGRDQSDETEQPRHAHRRRRQQRRRHQQQYPDPFHPDSQSRPPPSSPSIRMFRREEASQETRNPLSM